MFFNVFLKNLSYEISYVRILKALKDKELNALRKVLREEVKSHDDEIDQLRTQTREKVSNLKLELESKNDKINEISSQVKVLQGQGEVDLNRQQIVVENLKMAKQISELRRNLDESRSEIETSTRELLDQKRINDSMNERMKMSIEDPQIFTELELIRKEKDLSDVRLHRLESSVHSQGNDYTELIFE